MLWYKQVHQIGFLNLMFANVLEIWHWLWLTHFLQILRAMCDNVDNLTRFSSLKQGTQSIVFIQWGSSFLSNQPIRACNRDTFPTGNTWGLVSWRWCIVIIFDNLNIMNTLSPAVANTHKHLSSVVINNYAVRSLITASLWKLVKTFNF